MKIIRIFNLCSIFLILCFFIKTIVEYFQYNDQLNSAPFYLWIIVNAMMFILPAIILFIIRKIMERKMRKG